MSSQRGAAGVMIAIIVGLLVIGGGGYWIFKGKNVAQTKIATTTPESTDDASNASRSNGRPTIQRFTGMRMQNPPSLLSIIPIDKNLSKNQTAVFYKNSTSVGASSDASAYVQINIPNPQSLVRIYPNPSSDQPAPGALPSSHPYIPPTNNNTAYYSDTQNIYVLEDSSSSGGGVTLTIVQASDPDTFQLLSDTYAKDSQHVYLITEICDAQGVCTQGLVIIQGADPATFQAFEPSVVEQSDGTGTVTIDAIDIHNEYNNGIVVDVVVQDSAVYKKYYGTADPNGLILLAP